MVDRRAAPADTQAFRFSENNLDLVRLAAAGEVALRHCTAHLQADGVPRWLDLLLLPLPGVPVFFFLSGYLISRSWERSPAASDYFRNRALRLFPALWACIALSTAMLVASGYLASVSWAPGALALWIACQGTAFQSWNPDFLRGFGTGVVNGSLWSIAVEIQFYCAMPVVGALVHRMARTRGTLAWLCVAIAFMPLNAARVPIQAWLAGLPAGSLLAKAYASTLLPWFCMFALGAVAQRCSARLVPALVARAPAVVAAYLACIAIDAAVLGLPLGNEMPVHAVPFMGAAVLALGYSAPGLGRRVLRGMDLSYGLYIHHMPVVNLLRYAGITGAGAVGAALASTAILALGSWHLVERPFLRRKRHAMRPTVGSPAAASTGASPVAAGAYIRASAAIDD